MTLTMSLQEERFGEGVSMENKQPEHRNKNSRLDNRTYVNRIKQLKFESKREHEQE